MTDYYPPKEASGLFVEVYKDALAPLTKQFGELGGSVGNCLSLIFLPIHLLGQGAAHVKGRTQKKLAERFEAREDKRVDGDPAVLIPTIEGLLASYQHDELVDLFANLLGAAMDEDYKDSVHPRFAIALRGLCPTEAKLLTLFLADYRSIFRTKEKILIQDARSITENAMRHERSSEFAYSLWESGFSRAVVHNVASTQLAETYFENLQALGLIERCGERMFAYTYTLKSRKRELLEIQENQNSIVNQSREDLEPELLSYIANQDLAAIEDVESPGIVILIRKETFRLTKFGITFCNICGVVADESH